MRSSSSTGSQHLGHTAGLFRQWHVGEHEPPVADRVPVGEHRSGRRLLLGQPRRQDSGVALHDKAGFPRGGFTMLVNGTGTAFVAVNRDVGLVLSASGPSNGLFVQTPDNYQYDPLRAGRQLGRQDGGAQRVQRVPMCCQAFYSPGTGLIPALQPGSQSDS